VHQSSHAQLVLMTQIEQFLKVDLHRTEKLQLMNA
jgi:hypothetical protein